MDKPLISVIVPVYNMEKYVAKCIESIVGQTYQNLEIILVDDGSRDCSNAICKEYAAKDSRILVVKKENGGLAGARNEGLKYIHGNYVAFVDSDDWIEADTYEIMLREAQTHPNYVITCGRYNVDECSGIRTPFFDLPDCREWSREEAIKHFLTWDKMDTSVCDKLFPTSIIRGLRFPNGLVSEDVLFTYPALERCKGVVHIGGCKYNYLQRDGSITHTIFSEKTRGLLVYPEAVWNSVLKNLPELEKEADYYRFSRAIIYVQIAHAAGCKEKEATVVIQKYMGRIIRNSVMTWKEKVMALSMAVYAFDVLIKVYHMWKRGASY